jgi:hypothetical protein
MVHTFNVQVLEYRCSTILKIKNSRPIENMWISNRHPPIISSLLSHAPMWISNSANPNIFWTVSHICTQWVLKPQPDPQSNMM